MAEDLHNPSRTWLQLPFVSYKTVTAARTTIITSEYAHLKPESPTMESTIPPVATDGLPPLTVGEPPEPKHPGRYPDRLNGFKIPYLATMIYKDFSVPENLYLGLTTNELNEATVLDQFAMDFTIKRFLEDEIFVLEDSPHARYWLPYRVSQDRSIRSVSGSQIRKRLQCLSDYKVSWAKDLQHEIPSTALEESRVPTSFCKGPWCDIRVMALLGHLQEHSENDLDGLLAGICDVIYGGKKSRLIYRPQWKYVTSDTEEDVTADTEDAVLTQSPSAQLMTLPSLSPPERNIFVDDSEGVEDNRPNPRPVRKRYRKPVSKKATAKKGSGKVRAHKRDAQKGVSQLRAGANDKFGINTKHYLSSIGADQSKYAAFDHAIVPDCGPDSVLPPCPNFRAPDGRSWSFAPQARNEIGDVTGLHESEIQLCMQAALTGDKYKTQKARAFLGLALFLEFNERCPRSGKGDKPSAFGISQLQMPCNIDVNKSSMLFGAFKAFRWLEGVERMKMGGDVSELHARFPPDHRKTLLKAMKKWENEDLPEVDRSLCASFVFED